MNNALISIIIPVFNGDKYLSKALDSVITQTYSNIEIFVVDDGSTDGTASICDLYCKKDTRIFYIHKVNGGQGSARNIGIQKSHGDYILFLDSDDTYERHLCETVMSNIAPNIDILLFGFNIFKNGKLLRQPNVGHLLFENNDLRIFEMLQNLIVSSCNKLYKKTYITHLFDVNCVHSEDSIFNYSNLKQGCKIKSIPDCLYNVNLDTPDSVNKRYKSGKLSDIIKAINNRKDKMFELFADYQNDKQIIADIKTILFTIEQCTTKLSFHNAKCEISQSVNKELIDVISIKWKGFQLYEKISLMLLKKKHYSLIIFYFKLLHNLKSLLRKIQK